MELPQQPINPENDQLAQWVRAAQDGDRGAFAQLFKRYERAVRALAARRLGNHAEAQELCQEVFLQAMEKIGQLHNPVCFGAWLRSITKRMAINRQVRARRTASLEADRLAAACIHRETPLGAILAREEHYQVQVGLGRLPDLDRATLVAFYFRGCSLVEMSDEFDSPVGTIKRRLHVARKRLARELAALEPA